LKQYLTLTLLTLSLVLGLSSLHVKPVWATVSTDPQGDTFGRGSVQLDISSIDAQFNKTYLDFKTSFYTPILPAHVNAPNSVVGFIDVDSDRNPSTGALSLIDVYKPPGYPPSGLRDEYVISIFFEAGSPGNAGVFNAITGSFIGTAPITFTPNSYTISVPLRLIGGNGLVNYGTVIGTFLEPTDLAPNSCCATSELMVPPPRTVLSLTPTVNTAPKGGAFQASIRVSNASALSSFDIFLTFDPTLLAASAPSDTGNVLRNYCSLTPGCLGVNSQLASGPGFVEMKESLIGNFSLAGFTGSGPIFSATFTVAKSGIGTTPIRITSSSTGLGDGILATSTGSQIQHSSEDGVFSNGGPDMFVTAVPDELSMVVNSSDISALRVFGLNGLTGPISLALSGVPLNVNAVLNQTTVSLTNSTASTKLAITVGATAIPGNYTISIIGSAAVKSKIVTETGSLQLTILPPVPDFSISLSQSSITIPSGGSGSVQVTIQSIHGFHLPVNLSVLLPIFGPGLTTSFSINPVTPPTNGQGSTTLTLLVNALDFPQTVPLEISASSGSITHTTSLSLQISSFFIFTQPFPLMIRPGETVVTFAQIVSVNGFTGTVQLGIVPVPAGITATLSTNSVTLTNATSASVALTISASPTITAGNVVLFITGTSGNTFNTGFLQLQITDFSVAAGQADLTVPATGSATSSIFLSSLNGFTGFVNLQVTGAPSGVSATIAPNSIFLSSGNSTSTSSTLTVNASGATAGNYDLTITGSSGPTVHKLTVKLHVTDFMLTSSPSTLNLSPRQVSSTTVTIASLNGFAQPVTLTVSGLPLGVTAALTPSSLAGGAGVSTLTLTLGNKPALGTFIITVTATSGMIVHTSTITLIITK
jgi:hypothetical protein